MSPPEIHELTLPDALAGERLDVALAQLARGAQFRGFLGFARFPQRANRFGKLLVIAEARGDLRARQQIFGRQVALLRKFRVVIQRIDTPHRSLDLSKHTQHIGLLGTQLLGRVDLQPGHPVVGLFEIVFGFGREIARPPTCEKVVTDRAQPTQNDQGDRQDGQRAQNQLAAAAFFGSGNHSRILSC